MDRLKNRFCVTLLLILTGAGWKHAAQSRDSAKRAPYNIILLTPDQLSADYMHTYGYPYPDTPNIDRFAREGTLFLHAYSAGSWTTPSFGSILTGLFPTVHGMTLPPYESCGPYITTPLTNGKLPPVPDDLKLSRLKPILPELLKPAGMITAGDNANCWSIWDIVSRGWDSLKFFPGYQLPVPGHPGESSFYLTAPQTTQWAEEWLRAHRRSTFFFWVHYMEPHTPYNAPPQFDRFKEPEDFPDVSVAMPGGLGKLYRLAMLGEVHAIHRLRELYAAKILYMDNYVGHLLDTVRSLGLERNTVVILVSDHGQLLYSHPEDFNMDDHRSVYDADEHVPLIFWGTGIPAARRVNALAGHYDLVPTILSLEGLPLPKLADGKTLLPVLKGTANEVHHYVYSEETALTPQYAIRGQRYKLIETMRSGTIQCFDLQVDPNEQASICDQIPEEASRLKATLDEHIARMVREAHSFPDWQHNQALAVLEQRDTPQLKELSPQTVEMNTDDGEFQLTDRSLWRLSPNGVFWVPKGDGSAWGRARFDTPTVGEYEVALRWEHPEAVGQRLATNANFLLRFKGGSRSFVVDLNNPPRRNGWLLLGNFHDPISVTLSNRANGPIVAGAVRFVRIQNHSEMTHR